MPNIPRGSSVICVLHNSYYHIKMRSIILY